MSTGSARWLLLIHHLPAEPSNLRVKVWRRLQAVGAVLVKNSVYVLPQSEETREDLEWIRGEIVAQGGEAVLFAADAVDDLTDDEVVDAFVAARRADWEKVRAQAGQLGEQADAGESAPSLTRELQALRNRAAQIDRIDYFRGSAREEALRALDGIGAEVRSAEKGETVERSAFGGPEAYRGRRWLTRPRPGVDRMASAWLIRRFIDPKARFEFAERIPTREDVVPFDMFGVEFGHHGDRCTFETLVASFGLDEPAVARIGRIVHALDLRTEASVEAEAATIGRLVSGLREAVEGDSALLDRGMDLFESLYLSYREESPGDVLDG